MENSKPQESVWTVLTDTLTSPSEAFAAIARTPRGLFPLLLLTLASLAVSLYYFSVLDLAWWVDDTLAQAELSGEQLEAARDNLLQTGRGVLATIGTITAALSTFIFILLQAGYMSLAGALTGSRFKFRHWFALAAWGSTPYLIGSIAMLVNIALHSTGQLSATALDPTSLAALGLNQSEALEPLMRGITLPMLWSLALFVLGFSAWQQSTIAKAAAIILTPYLLVLTVILALL